MSTVAVIVGIVILLAALVSYAFISQTLQQKREQRKRLLAALKAQARSFKFMLDGCPDGFLTKELKVIVLKSLVDASEQLLALTQGEKTTYSQDIQTYNSMLSEALRSPPTKHSVQLESAQQIKEVKMSLESLHKFVFKQEEQKKLNRSQADSHRSQIKQLVLQVSVDGYILHGKQAAQNDKTKLAVHYFDLAIKLLVREGKAGAFDNRIAQLKQVHSELMEKLSEEEAVELPMEDPETQADLDEEWDKYSTDSEDIWKKKNVYD